MCGHGLCCQQIQVGRLRPVSESVTAAAQAICGLVIGAMRNDAQDHKQ